jgi:DNA-directed RNA polymerase specialized sigma subunit
MQAKSLSAVKLTQAHLPLVGPIARRYTGRGEGLEDLVQLGARGMVEASRRFDPSRGVAF